MNLRDRPQRRIAVVGDRLVELGLADKDSGELVLGFGGDAPNAAVMAGALPTAAAAFGC